MNRISKNKYNCNEQKRIFFTTKKKVIIFSVIVIVITILAVIMGRYIYRANGNIADAAINMVADAVGDETPITVLVMGVSTDLNNELTDTIILVRI